ncbi:DNA mismatch repair protein MutS, partial [bacterium]|nr:DNA mismatch repair protein MutS [bacterium]
MGKDFKSTPMMEQYLAIKAKHQDAILFFRMGDFYEMFFDDAKVAAEVLGLALTSRAHGKSADVPLAGFPHHSLDSYLGKMVKAGYRVAICEQLEDPRLAKGVVKRDVTEVVTPGTVMSDDLLSSKRNNFLAGLYVKGNICGISYVDISTGEFSLQEVPRDDFVEELEMSAPTEILISQEQAEFVAERLGKSNRYFVTKREEWIFSRDFGYESLTSHFGTLSLKGFGCEDMDVGICAAGAVLHYLKEVQKNHLPQIRQISRLTGDEFVSVDSDTRRNLEILRSMRAGTTAGSLLAVIDRTKTPMGGRKLVQWLLKPLQRPTQIQLRLDAVEELGKDSEALSRLSEELAKVGDLERYIAKVTTNRASARDLKELASSLKIIPLLKQLLSKNESQQLRQFIQNSDDLNFLVKTIDQAIIDKPPLSVTEGGFIKRGYSKDLDNLRDIAFSGKDWIARLQTEEREQTAIPSLKVGFNKVFGYYIEVTKPNLSKVPERYIRKQTLVNAERFITPELKAYEEKVLDAEDKIVTLEYELFDQVRRKTASQAATVQENARQMSTLDCLVGFALLAIENSYVKPIINSDAVIQIEEGRHPVVEKLLPYGESFVPNDSYFDTEKQQLIILTGPNMAGKSTYLRQIGLLVLLAQVGSFIPAKKATVGVVDKIFTRVGASDNLAGGESTFLVEMNETANILNNATPKSVILLDEIGRGTSTFDGLSIAWAVAEHIHNYAPVRAKCIFATHYHE